MAACPGSGWSTALGAYNYIELRDGLRLARRGRGVPFVSSSDIAFVLRVRRTGAASVERVNGCGVRGAGEYNRYGVCGPAERVWRPGTG
jgi:hypothetical protein